LFDNNVYYYNLYGTLLHWSCYCNCPKSTKLLLDRGADISIKFRGDSEFNDKTALEIARLLNYNNIISLFSEQKAEEARKTEEIRKAEEVQKAEEAQKAKDLGLQ